MECGRHHLWQGVNTNLKWLCGKHIHKNTEEEELEMTSDELM